MGAERPADLNRADRLARGAAAAIVVQELPERKPEGALHESPAADVARELDRQRAARLAHTKARVGLRAVRENPGNGREGYDVVDDRRLPEQTLDGRERRPHPHFPAPALETLEHRGLFAADVGARAEADLELEALTRAGDIAAEVAGLVGRGDGGAERPQGMRVLGAQINVALGGADRDAGDGHALDEREGIPLHQHAVGEGARVALVGVAGDVLLARRLIEHGLPLDAGREGRSATTAQPRARDRLHDGRRRHRKRLRQSLVAAVLHIVRNQRVEALGRDAAMKAPVDHDRGGAGAVAETVDRLEREASVGGRLVKIDPEAAPRVRGESLRTHRLTRLGLTQAHQVSAGARVAEVVVEADDAVHLGAREVQALGHQGNGSLRYKAECRLYSLQYFG